MKATHLFLRTFPVAAAIVVSSCSAPVQSANKPAEPAKKPVSKSAPPRLRPSERGEVSSISLEETFELQQSGNVLIYDARPSVHYNAGHIAGAVNIPKSISGDVLDARDPILKAAKAANKPIIVYCTGVLCHDARTVARQLASRGYSSSIFSGGWDQWKAADLPTE